MEAFGGEGERGGERGIGESISEYAGLDVRVRRADVREVVRVCVGGRRGAYVPCTPF